MLLSAAEGVGPSRNGCIMTKDRARKQAARQRAALTGERYVVAQRATTEPEPHTAGRLHEFTHRMPGVPAHVPGGLQAKAPRNRNARPVSRQHSRHNEPRVLIAWQNWIAKRLGASSH
jgi:hypothetical protein